MKVDNIKESELHPRQVIERFFEQQLTGRQLLRCLASFAHWLAPASFDDGQPALLELRLSDSRHFYMFSDMQAYDAGRAAVGADVIGDHYLELTGDGVWLSFNDAVQAVNINPHSEHQIHYKQDQFPILRQWAKTIRVERALGNVLSTDSGYDVIREFDRYYVVLRSDESGPNLMLAPDSKGRKLAALFTAEDALDAYVEEMNQSGLQGLKPLMMTGAKLFDLLLKAALDGFAFNCCGPVTPRAFAPEFARRVSESNCAPGSPRS